MATEATWKRKIVRLLKPHGVYCQSFSNRFSRGVPDHWYSGNRGDLWVEHKFDTKSRIILPDLSAHQIKWANERYDEGRNVAVIVGTSLSGGLIFAHKTWMERCPAADSVPIEQIVAFILRQTINDHSSRTTDTGTFFQETSVRQVDGSRIRGKRGIYG